MIWYDMRTHDMSCFVSYDCFDWYDVIHPYPHRSKDSPNSDSHVRSLSFNSAMSQDPPYRGRLELRDSYPLGVYKCTWVLMTMGLWVSGIHYRDMILCYPWHIHQQHGANFFFTYLRLGGNSGWRSGQAGVNSGKVLGCVLKKRHHCPAPSCQSNDNEVYKF